MMAAQTATTDLSARFSALFSAVPLPSRFESDEQFNGYCRGLYDAWRRGGRELEKSETFQYLEERIAAKKDGIITTGWGGVDVLRYDHPIVTKYLVVRAGGYLSYEKHEQKQEELWVHDGLGALVSRPSTASAMTVQPLHRGVYAQFEPGNEHCIIALENLIVFERSADFKGMDKDLIFLFEPK